METIDKEWMDETCGTCVFRDISGHCRRRPPVKTGNLYPAEPDKPYQKYTSTGEYIRVYVSLSACYDWRRAN